MRKTANIYHHTHWDNEWYFTEEDSLVQLTYHMKELIRALEENVIDYFYLDGQTAILEDYLELHKEDENKVRHLIENEKLFVGPFNTQIDSFITSGESLINNLRYGMNYANRFGKTSKVAYLPDSFGQSQDYPKIFNQLGINSFVFRRGMGDEHNLPLDFVFRSNDGSSVITTTLDCGYGFATEPFINQTLTRNAGLDYDGKDIKKQLKKLADNSTLKNDFLLPIGNDQTPVIWKFKELLKSYENDDTYEFVETTLAEYMMKLKKNEEALKVYEGEFINPQHHRVHRSIYSARMDIKILQDKLERMMALEIQPIMSILNDLQLDYDSKMIDRIWNLLGRSQTHSGATNTDKTNELILKRTEKAYSLAEALKIYMIRKVSISLNQKNTPIVFFNTLPNSRDMIMNLDVYTKGDEFSLVYQGKEISYTIQSQDKIYGGVVRKEVKNQDEALYFYKTSITLKVESVTGFSYNTIYVDENSCNQRNHLQEKSSIENNFYRIEKDKKGFSLFAKNKKELIPEFIYFEESGDEGDNYDYSYPTKDMKIIDNFDHVEYSFKEGKEKSILIIKGNQMCPKNLEARANQELNQSNEYEIQLVLNENDPVIKVEGSYFNECENHRVRLVVKTSFETTSSIAGTQFGYIERENHSTDLASWKQQGWLEEPTPIYPLLNYVLLKKEKQQMGVFTKSSKEYEVVGTKGSDIAITLFRSVGHLGLPDLNRRPGRASGLAEKIIPSPLSQLKKENKFEIGIIYTDNENMNDLVNVYNEFVVEDCYYQNQKYNKVVYPITYFQTNQLEGQVKDSYSLSSNSLFNNCAFSTLEMIDNKKVVRVFNNEKEQSLSKSIKKHDFFGKELEISNSIKKGEILTLVVEDEK